jgi:hypothetical protein
MGAAAALSVWIFFSVDSSSHSVSDTFYGSVAAIGLVWLVALAVVFVLRRTISDP